ncbi:chemotaxis signal transduction protein [Sinorhizobium fredii]
MTGTLKTAGFDGETLEIIAFRLHDQEFCVKTTTIREIRGWAPSTPIPHSPPEVIGVMNLRGTVIPIIDLAHKLGMKSTVANERSAIVVAEVHNMVIGPRRRPRLRHPDGARQPGAAGAGSHRLLRQELC